MPDDAGAMSNRQNSSRLASAEQTSTERTGARPAKQAVPLPAHSSREAIRSSHST